MDHCPKCKQMRFLEDTEGYKLKAARLNQMNMEDDNEGQKKKKSNARNQSSVVDDDEDDVTVSQSRKKGSTKTPRHVYRYCPMIPMLKELIAHPVFSHLFRHGDTNMKMGNADARSRSEMNDIHQSPCYHRFAAMFPLKSEDPVNGTCDMRIALAAGADRASLSKHKQHATYAVLPILAMILNWPIHVTSKETHLLLVGVPPFKSHNPSLFFRKLPHAMQSNFDACMIA